MLSGQETIIKTFKYEKWFKLQQTERNIWGTDFYTNSFQVSPMALTFERPDLQNISAIKGKEM